MIKKIVLDDLKIDCLVLTRKKEALNKPKFYLFDVNKKAFITSLYPTKKENIYTIDLKAYGKNEFYLVKLSDSLLIEVLSHSKSFQELFIKEVA